MSGGKHTPGRVEMLTGYDGSISVAAAGPCRINLTTAGTPIIADVCRHADAEFFDGEANARRIVACWNACMGLSTEALERLGTLDKARVELDVLRAQLMEQRDELAEALQLMLEQFTKTPSTLKDSEARIKAHAALSRATGSKS